MRGTPAHPALAQPALRGPLTPFPFLIIQHEPVGTAKTRALRARETRKPHREEREEPRTFHSQETCPGTDPAAGILLQGVPSRAGASLHPDPSLRGGAPALPGAAGRSARPTSLLPQEGLPPPLTSLTRHAGADVMKTMCFSNLVVQLVFRALALSVFIRCNIHHTGLFMGPLFGKVFFRPGE